MKRHRIIAALAGLALAPLSAPAPATAAPAGVRVDLRILLITDGGPATGAYAAYLRSVGVPVTAVDLNDENRAAITPGFLAESSADGAVRAKYQAVVVPNDAPFGAPGEFEALAAYERQYGVRQVDAYLWPTPAVGLDYPTFSGVLDGAAGGITAAGLGAPFGYLRGSVPFADNSPDVSESYGFLTQPLPDPSGATSFTPLVTAVAPGGGADGVLAGVYAADGREQLVITFSYNAAQPQFLQLAPGILDWATRGVHLGRYRNYLSVQVDDVFNENARWDEAHNCTPGNDCPAGVEAPEIRMTPADVTYASDWQSAHGFTLDFAYNALGSVFAEEAAPNQHDALTDALLAAKDSFRWTNHTYSHRFLGCLQDVTVVPWRCETDAGGDVRYVSKATVNGEIGDNSDWATQHGLPIVATELVTGEHSGLRILPQQPDPNPNLAPALTDAGVKWLAADASRMPNQEKIGPAYTVPRRPFNVFHNVATVSEEVDEYNWIYTSRANGGSGLCEDNPSIMTCIAPLDAASGYSAAILPLETRLALARILANDPRPHFAHQSNLTEDRLLYPLLDGVLSGYRSLFADSAPVVNQRLSANGAELLRQREWADAVSDGTVNAYLSDGVVSVDAPAGVAIPLTVPPGSTAGGEAFGDAYAGSRSAWSDAASLVVTLP